MGWHGTLALRYRSQDGRTVVHDRHDGPLRVLKMLHPEGDSVCHSILVHPPGGIVGGDRLAVEIEVEPGAQALVTTPGATRFYRSAGETASQSVAIRVAAESRFEWLPLETIAFSGCLAENRACFELAHGAEMIGWDVTALGLPASSQPFEKGFFTQSIELPGCWLERGTMRGDDACLLGSPLGWGGHAVLATLWFAAGSALLEARRDALLELARTTLNAHPLRATAGASAAQARVIVVRALSPRVEPAMDLLSRIWSACPAG